MQVRCILPQAQITRRVTPGVSLDVLMCLSEPFIVGHVMTGPWIPLWDVGMCCMSWGFSVWVLYETSVQEDRFNVSFLAKNVVSALCCIK